MIFGNGIFLVSSNILRVKHSESSDTEIDKRRKPFVKKEIVCAEINGNSRKLVLFMVAISNSQSDTELLIDESFVNIIC